MNIYKYDDDGGDDWRHKKSAYLPQVNFRGSRDHDHALFSKKLKGHVGTAVTTVPRNTHVKFDVRVALTVLKLFVFIRQIKSTAKKKQKTNMYYLLYL